LEKNALIEALKITEGNVEQAARRLDLSRATIYRKIKKYKIE
jgi:transcriptional regulator of acetoin/glycerol metabolism